MFVIAVTALLSVVDFVLSVPGVVAVASASSGVEFVSLISEAAAATLSVVATLPDSVTELSAVIHRLAKLGVVGVE